MNKKHYLSFDQKGLAWNENGKKEYCYAIDELNRTFPERNNKRYYEGFLNGKYGWYSKDGESLSW